MTSPTTSCDDSLIPVQEFDDWISHQENSSGTKDGAVVLVFGFLSDEASTFSIKCPPGYPTQSDMSCFIQIWTDSQKLKAWVAAAQEFAKDRNGEVKLSAVLAKCLELYQQDESRSKILTRPLSQSSNQDSDYGEGDNDYDDDEMPSGTEDEELVDDDFYTTDWDIKMDLKKKKWSEKEKELRATWAKEKNELEVSRQKNCGLTLSSFTDPDNWDSVHSYHAYSYSFMTCGKPDLKKTNVGGEPVKPGQQIFSHESAAFQILSNEMINLLKDGANEGFVCDTVEDSLYKWSVKMRDFPAGTQLQKETALLKHKYGYDYVELELDLVPDFPFYPPLLRVVRPRFMGSLVQSLANIDLLTLTYWNPTRTIHEVLLQIKAILLKHAT